MPRRITDLPGDSKAYGSDKTISAAWNGLDVTRMFGAISEGPAIWLMQKLIPRSKSTKVSLPHKQR